MTFAPTFFFGYHPPKTKMDNTIRSTDSKAEISSHIDSFSSTTILTSTFQSKLFFPAASRAGALVAVQGRLVEKVASMLGAKIMPMPRKRTDSGGIWIPQVFSMGENSLRSDVIHMWIAEPVVLRFLAGVRDHLREKHDASHSGESSTSLQYCIVTR
ncbi:hypothetical protein BX600DRAFT_186072 [Xylariales sp. PMI_506]|nr:hypothetical protein BX600DRAFT_186072 [Xylariales sp. PMI_506]